MPTKTESPADAILGLLRAIPRIEGWLLRLCVNEQVSWWHRLGRVRFYGLMAQLEDRGLVRHHTSIQYLAGHQIKVRVYSLAGS